MSRAIASSANPHPLRLVYPNCGSEPAREDLQTVVIVPKRQAIVYELGERAHSATNTADLESSITSAA